jgi:hypothetical protein
MFKKIYQYLLAYPLINTTKRLWLYSMIFVFFQIINNTYPINFWITFIITSLFAWTGLGFVFLVYYIHILNNESYSIIKKSILLFIGGLMTLAVFISPIIFLIIKKTQLINY